MGNPFFREYDLLILGELFAEFSSDVPLDAANQFKKNMGGSDIYTAVTAARQGASTGLISSIGRDPFTKMIRQQLSEEKINTDYVISSSGFNGIYFLDDEPHDKREYLFNRSGNALNNFSPSMIDDSLIASTRIIYSSSEFQMTSRSCRQAVFKAFYSGHTNDTMVAYDPNLRLHNHSLEDAQEALWSILPFVDVMLPSAPEESKALFGYERPVDIIGFLWDRGIHVVAVKNGEHGAMIGYDGKFEEIPVPEGMGSPKSLSMVGSVFNGAFLQSIAKGFDPFTAGRLAVEVASGKAANGLSYQAIPQVG